MKIRCHLSIGLIADVEEVIELPDELTPEEVESKIREWALGRTEWSHEVVENA